MKPFTLAIWTVYDNPKDFPGKFVARRWTVGKDLYTPVPDRIPIVRDTLSEIRLAIPQGLQKIPTSPVDDPTIVESWI